MSESPRCLEEDFWTHCDLPLRWFGGFGQDWSPPTGRMRTGRRRINLRGFKAAAGGLKP